MVFEVKNGPFLSFHIEKKQYRRVQQVLNTHKRISKRQKSPQLARAEFFPKKINFSCSPLYIKPMIENESLRGLAATESNQIYET